MTSKLHLALAVLAGVGIGATAISGLRAQGTPPAYLVTDFSEIVDAAGFAAASKGVPAAVAASGGKLIMRSDNAVAVDGPVPKRFAVFQFENTEKAKAFATGAAMKEAQDGRLKFTKSRSFIVEGMPN